MVSMRLSQSPAVRAAARLVELVRRGDEIRKSGDGFDPWHHAALVRAAEAGDEGARQLLAEAFARYREARERYHGGLVRSPEEQIIGTMECLSSREAIERGDGTALMRCVELCAAHGLVMPGWLAGAFVDRTVRVTMGEFKSWDEAFGPPYPKGTNIAGVRARRVYGAWAYRVAASILADDPNRPLDRGFYEEVGERIGRSHSEVSKLMKAYLGEAPGLYPQLSYIRERCLEGMSVAAAMCRWSDESFLAELRRQGLEQGSDGSITEAPEKR